MAAFQKARIPGHGLKAVVPNLRNAVDSFLILKMWGDPPTHL